MSILNTFIIKYWIFFSSDFISTLLKFKYFQQFILYLLFSIIFLKIICRFLKIQLHFVYPHIALKFNFEKKITSAEISLLLKEIWKELVVSL